MAPITFAHRGGRADDAPENSLVAFRRALALGATGLESDARLSADGQVVLVHGSTVRVGIRRAKVGALSAARLAELGVPRWLISTPRSGRTSSCRSTSRNRTSPGSSWA